MTERAHLIAAFLDAHGWGTAERRLLAADASFRRYERLRRGAATAVLMDAPPPRENVAAFHRVARQLLDLGLSAPRPIAVDEAAGLMLLEDLGDRTFTRALAAGADEAHLYRLAVDLLIALHRDWHTAQAAGLPPYDDARLLEEALLLPDWALPAVRGVATAAAARDSYIEAWRAVLPRARSVADALVLRDFHVDNLMLLDDRGEIAGCGLLDFQDAVVGPR
ncbi:MAG TPA: phosphotransferase, partial [Kiloniellales bacterium]